MSKKTVYTCYGCHYYFRNNPNPLSYPEKHCGKDHTKCDYYWGKSDNIGETIEQIELNILERYGKTREELMNGK